MIEHFIVSAMAASIVTGLAGVWILICNYRTRIQRTLILWQADKDAMTAIGSGDANWRRFYDDFGRVSYDRHLFHVATFRDPMQLYKSSGEQA